jgi:hypothetical protein
VWHVVLWESTIAGPKLGNIDNDDEEDTDDKITTTYVGAQIHGGTLRSLNSSCQSFVRP